MNEKRPQIPAFFRWLLERNGLASENDMLFTEDGCGLLYRSVASLLEKAGIDTFPDRDGKILACRNYFDDWFLYAVGSGEAAVYSLFKMREQEHDREAGIQADGDTPGVTISFISMNVEILKDCLLHDGEEKRKKLGMEINRVVAYSGQAHHPQLKEYFVSPQSQGAYRIAELYIRHLASFAVNGGLDVPVAYREMVRKREQGKRYGRVPDFIDGNNRAAGRVVCDHQKITVADFGKPDRFESLAILAVHTGNVSLHSFAAEVRYHARFLTNAAKIRLPLLGSPYASAVRADMSIGDKEFQGPTPYYDLDGKLVAEQKKYHMMEIL